MEQHGCIILFQHSVSFLFASLYFPAAHFGVKIKWRGCAGVLNRSHLLLNAPCKCFYFLMFFIFRNIFHILLVSFHMTGMCRCPPPSAKMHLTKFFLLKLFDFFVHIFLIFFTLSWHLLCDKDVKIPPAAEMDLANCLLFWIFCHLKIQCFFL